MSKYKNATDALLGSDDEYDSLPDDYVEDGYTPVYEKGYNEEFFKFNWKDIKTIRQFNTTRKIHVSFNDNNDKQSVRPKEMYKETYEKVTLAKMKNIYTILNGIQTHLITWGDPFQCNGEDIVICITGNPGVADFYIEFGEELHKNTNLSVCVVGHSGHEEVPDKASNILENQKHLFNLEAQIAHKLDLISKMDKTSKLHLVGHSIGAWMVLQAIEKDEGLLKRVKSVNLLFPTIQRMAESRNGRVLNNVLRRIHVLAILLFMLIHSLHNEVKEFLIGIYLRLNSLPGHYVERISKYLNPLVCEKVLFLAYDEMDSVVDLNTRILDKVRGLTNVIYSSNDGWAPVHYMDDLKQFQPQLSLKEVPYDHSFVLKSWEPVAEMVSDYIKSKN